MTVDIVTLVQLFLEAVCVGFGIVAALTLTLRRQAPQSMLLALVMCAEAFYCLGYSQEIAQTTLAGAVFWLRVEYIGIPWIPALWILVGRRHFGLPARTLPLAVIPIIVTWAEWTNGTHGLYDRSMELVQRGPFWVVTVVRGPIAWLNLAYLYGGLAYGVVLCWTRIRKSTGLVRLQSIVFALSCVPPLIGYLLYFLGWSPWGLDISPLTLCLTVVIVYIAVFRLEWFNLVPTARSLVFKSIRDAVLVTDLEYRLVDFNPAAAALFPELSGPIQRTGLSKLFPPGCGFTEAVQRPEEIHQISLFANGMEQQFELSFFALHLRRQHLGWAAILANITAQIEFVKRLQHHAETDALTEVANRRAFDAAMDQESARTTRYHSSFAVMLIDVDNFKTVNDRDGHAMEDKLLHLVARRMVDCLRSTDIPGRYGGDEFAVLLPETHLHEAREVAERIRREVAFAAASLAGLDAPVTLSIGLTVHMPGNVADPRELLEQADRALYSAKSNGRNCVGVWKGLSVDVNSQFPAGG